jgi:hypothetical protein
MDYPSTFAGWHSIISSGHLITVLGFLFFLLMLADSFYENRAPVSKTRGVGRLNTRLSFYTYELRKLRSYQVKALPLLRRPGPTARLNLYRQCSELESTNIEYRFDSLHRYL